MPYRVRVATKLIKRGRYIGVPKRTSTKYKTLKSARHDAKIFANTYDIIKETKKGKITKVFLR